ncbi:hypothetical protein AGMMS49579_01270 [Spirochaetia bacterium]|nr:hypothetical protein AGMMS49579_01270 [Spirochaetia bacterium]
MDPERDEIFSFFTNNQTLKYELSKEEHASLLLNMLKSGLLIKDLSKEEISILNKVYKKMWKKLF